MRARQIGLRRRRQRLTHGDVKGQLRKMAGPMLIGLAAVIGFNAVDTFFVARLGTESLAAISFTFPVVLLVGSLGIGAGVGVSAVLARAIGREDDDAMDRLVGHALLLAVTVAAALIGFGHAIGMSAVFSRLGVPASLLGHVAAYMDIWLFAVGPLLVGMFANGVLRAAGDTHTPAAIMLAGMGLNLALDPMLIFGFGPLPALGIEGAAIATCIARWAMVSAVIGVLIRRDGLLRPFSLAPSVVVRSWRELAQVAAPAALARALVPISLAALTAIVATHGHAAVAAFGAGLKIDAVLALPVLAIAGVLTPFIGQNNGASRSDRVREALRLGRSLSFWTSAIAVAAMAVFASPLAALFSAEPAVQRLLALLLVLTPIGIGARGMLLVLNAGLNATGSPWLATALVAIRTPLLAVGFGFVGGTIFGAIGVFGGIVIADLCAGAIAMFVIRARFFAHADEVDARDRTQRAEQAEQRHSRATRRLIPRPSGARHTPTG